MATTSVIGEKRETSLNKLDPRIKLVQNLIELVHAKKNFFNDARRDREESWGIWKFLGFKIFGEAAK